MQKKTEAYFHASKSLVFIVFFQITFFPPDKLRSWRSNIFCLCFKLFHFVRFFFLNLFRAQSWLLLLSAFFACFKISPIDKIWIDKKHFRGQAISESAISDACMRQCGQINFIGRLYIRISIQSTLHVDFFIFIRRQLLIFCQQFVGQFEYLFSLSILHFICRLFFLRHELV